MLKNNFIFQNFNISYGCPCTLLQARDKLCPTTFSTPLFLFSFFSSESDIFHRGHGDFYAHWQIFYYFSHSHHQLGNGCCQYVGRLFLVKTANSNFCLTAHSTLRIQQNITQHDSKILSRFEANLPYLKPNSYSRLSVDSVMNLSQV